MAAVKCAQPSEADVALSSLRLAHTERSQTRDPVSCSDAVLLSSTSVLSSTIF